ncbi:MAG: DUF427 domain-containing protein [Rhodospirillales bacterium]|nr:DUF427 domain-containing protein [Rhodospirillales bacterium]
MGERVEAHRITIEPASARVRVILDGVCIAESTRALVLREGSLSPVVYIPRADVDPASLTRSAHRSHCPFKGDASYFTVSAGETRVENAAWSYEQPFSAVAAIRDHLAFYPSKVDAIEMDDRDAIR